MTYPAKLMVAGLLVLIVAFLFFYFFTTGPGAAMNAPQQPIAFFHQVHAGNKQIACEFCHRTVRSAAFAGMPSTQLCMRCHRVVIPNFPEIQKEHGYWDRRQAIPWVRVNRLPGFVFFDHHAHTVTAGLDCSPCHGNVRAMNRLRQTAPLNMGWCLACHRARRGPTYCWACHR